MIALPERPRILVVALRRIGDVLLTTPLIRSLRRAWPDALIDVLVFADTAAILTGNPDISTVISMPVRPSAGETAALLLRLTRRYALAISTQTGDRPMLFAVAAGRISVAPVGEGGAMAALKRAVVTYGVPAMSGLHRVEEMLRLADAIGVPRVAELVTPQGALRDGVLPPEPYAVIHPAPMFNYKRWTQDGWRKLIEGLAARGLKVVVTGGPARGERAYLDELLAGAPQAIRRDGQLAWHEIAELAAFARVFVGPDTSVTHLAAASGAKTVALFGPTDPRLWGPWPVGGLATPWAAAGTIQNRGNIWLVQNPLPCLPCQQEGCDRHLMSRSQCLDELSAGQVLAAVDQALSQAPSAGPAKSSAPA
jgi:heptosyltransferase-3